MLYDNGGTWQGKVIVPKAPIAESTTAYPVENPCADPCGYPWRIIRAWEYTCWVFYRIMDL